MLGYNFTFENEGYYLEACLADMKTAIDEYFLELNADWDNQQIIIVRIADIISKLMSVTGVLDVQNVKLNGSTINLILDKDSLAVRGTINEL